jgi:flagellin-like protein
MRTDYRGISSVIGVMLMVAVTVVLGVTLIVAGAAFVAQMGEPTNQAALDISETERGVKATVSASEATTPILVTRNNEFIGKFSATAGVTRQYYGSKGDTFEFIALDDAGERKAVLASHTVSRPTSFIGRLSLDEQSLSDTTISIHGEQKDVTVTGDVQKTSGKSGDAIQLLYRNNNSPSGIRIADVSEYESYTISFLLRSDGDTDDGNNAADDNYFETHLIGWEDGHSIVAYGGTQNDQLLLGTDRGYNPFASIETDERLPGASDWHLVTITRASDEKPTACVYSSTDGSSCQTLDIYLSQGGSSDFVIGDSKFSGEVDEVQLFNESLSTAEREQLRNKYFDG